MVHIHNPTANASSYVQFTNANTAGTGINDGTLVGISQNNSNTDGTGSGFTILQKENAEITLGTNNLERLRITSDGKLLVGTSTAFDFFNSSRVYIRGYLCSGRDDATVGVDNGIGGIRFYSNDTNIIGYSTDFLEVGTIECQADNDFLSGSAATRLMFSTVAAGSTVNTERLRINSYGEVGIGTTGGPAKLNVVGGIGVTGGLFEGAFIKAGKLSDNLQIGISTANVFYFTTQETTTAAPNIRWDNSNTLSSKMNVGDLASVTVITTAAAGGYSANWTIDGNAVTEEWVGGSAPSAGGSDGLDIYSLTIIKTGTGTGDSGFKVIANVSNAT